MKTCKLEKSYENTQNKITMQFLATYRIITNYNKKVIIHRSKISVSSNKER